MIGRLFIAEMRKIWRPLQVLALSILTGLIAVPVASTLHGNVSLTLPSDARIVAVAGPVADSHTPELLRAHMPDDRELSEAIQSTVPQAVQYQVVDYASVQTLWRQLDEEYPYDPAKPFEEKVEVQHRRDLDPRDQILLEVMSLPEYMVIANYIQGVDRVEYDLEQGNAGDTAVLRQTAAMQLGDVNPQDSCTNTYGPNGLVSTVCDDSLDNDIASQQFDAAHEARYRDLVEHPVVGTVTAPMNETATLMQVSAALAIAVAMLLTVPLAVRDRHYRVQTLQWSSRSGRRRISRVQTFAVAVSGLIAALVVVGAVMGTWAYLMRIYLAVPIAVSDFPWFNINVGQWMLMVALVEVTLSVTVTLGTFLLSRRFSAMIPMLLAQLPVTTVCAAVAALLVIPSAFLFANRLTRIVPIPGMELWSALIALAVMIGACWWANRRLSARELPNAR